MGVAQIQVAQNAIQAPRVRLSDYSSLEHAQAAQALLNYQAQVLQNQAANAGSPFPVIKPVTAQRTTVLPPQPVTAQPSVQAPLQVHIQKTDQDILAEQAFSNPRNPDQSLLQQTQAGHAISGSKLEQVELNLARLQAKGQITNLQAQNGLKAMQLATANNWLKHNGKNNPNGTVTYRGITVPNRMGSVLSYSDTQHYLETGKHISPRDNWQKALNKTMDSFLKGLRNGLTAGPSMQGNMDEEIPYDIGDIVGAILDNGINPDQWALYIKLRDSGS